MRFRPRQVSRLASSACRRRDGRCHIPEGLQFPVANRNPGVCCRVYRASRTRVLLATDYGRDTKSAADSGNEQASEDRDPSMNPMLRAWTVTTLVAAPSTAHRRRGEDDPSPRDYAAGRLGCGERQTLVSSAMITSAAANGLWSRT